MVNVSYKNSLLTIHHLPFTNKFDETLNFKTEFLGDEKQEIIKKNIFLEDNYRRMFFPALNQSDDYCHCFRKKAKHQICLLKKANCFCYHLHLSAIAFSKSISHGSSRPVYLYSHIM